MTKTVNWFGGIYLLKSEWKNIFKTPLLLASIVAVTMVPILYAGMLLWAFWDPYGSLPDLPVAIVNEDKGTTFEGKQLTLGDALTDKLVEEKTFNFVELSREEAIQDFNEEKYYMLIEIPEQFSAHATTLLDEEPSKLAIQYEVNQGYNFLSSQIGQSAIERIRTEVNKKVSATYAEQLFNSITKLADGYTEAADGATQITNGADKLANGTTELKGYLQQLSSGAVELSEGAWKVANGSDKAAKGSLALQEGVHKLTNGGEQLQAGAQSAAEGATNLQQGLVKYTNGVNELQQSYATLLENQSKLTANLVTASSSLSAIANGATNTAQGTVAIQQQVDLLAKQLQAVISSLPEQQAADLTASIQTLQATATKVVASTASLADNSTKLATSMEQIVANDQQLVSHYEEAQQGMDQLSAQSQTIQVASNKLVAGNATLSDKLRQLSNGLQQTDNGAKQLALGLHVLQDGSNSLNTGTATLASKSNELADGSITLVEGAEKLSDGTSKLANKLMDAGQQANEVQPTDNTYDMMANPVEIDKKVINEVPNYGTGFAPYFISLGLAVGALIFSNVYPFVEPAIRPTSARAWFSSKLSIFAVLGLLQALIVAFIVIFVVGVKVNHMPLFLLVAVLSSYTFLAIIQLLVSVLKDVGRFVGLLLLILQLTTSAGTFPIELIPQPLQIFYGKLPMTYTIEAFRSVISMEDQTMLWSDVAVLISVTMSCLVLTYLFFNMLFKRRYSKETV